MIIKEIQTHLFTLQDKEYKHFQVKLIPTISKETMIGIRTPLLKAYAKELQNNPDIHLFLKHLPHDYFDENQLHAFIIQDTKDFQLAIKQVEAFLPFVDNWATCDQLKIKIFKKHKKELLPHIDHWLQSSHPYTIRYAIGLLMSYFLDEDFHLHYVQRVACIHSEDYYINMMIAWYFATALAKQYAAIIPFLKEQKLSLWVHNKTIQKAIESRRLSSSQKEELKSLRRKRNPQ